MVPCMRFLINQGAARLRAKASESRVRVFILVHLEYFLADPKSMKVLSHEDDVLREELGADIASLKRQYYRRGADPGWTSLHRMSCR